MLLDFLYWLISTTNTQAGSPPKVTNEEILKVLQLLDRRIQHLELAFSSTPRNDCSKGISKLPEEIVGKILDYVNQRDILSLSLTHRSFETICRKKLLEKICVVSDDYDFFIPKYWYGSHVYTSQTVLRLSQFHEVLKHKEYTSFMKNVKFDNDALVSISFLDDFIRSNLGCEIEIRHSGRKLIDWIANHKKERLSMLRIVQGLGGKFEENQWAAVHHLDLSRAPSDVIIKSLLVAQRFNNLKRVTLRNPSSFKLDRRVSVAELNLFFDKDATQWDVLNCFELKDVKKLDYKGKDEALLKKVRGFRALQSFSSSLAVQNWIQFIEQLPSYTLSALVVPGHALKKMLEIEEKRCRKSSSVLLNRHDAEVSKQWSAIVDALLLHKDSLRTLMDGKFKGLARKGVPKLFFDITSFPKLETIISDRVVWKVDMTRKDILWVPIEYCVCRLIFRMLVHFVV
ncbi:hypothetical protein Cantr_07950 [Candida viswanathii]|uniref:F-box domain-containing protein n=1 Tax=Candida viswanathii TaxID=5486 RepID=A0A367Y1M5_9ASCO|nr:hypothetical protein Cantr_07950 [Candida viswanathii]